MAALTPERLAEVQSEHGQQVALFAWAALPETRAKCPGIEWMFAVPNGGERNIKVAGQLKAEGVRKGVADIFLPVPNPGWYHGLFIELKFGKNQCSDEQTKFLLEMKTRGYHVAVCWTFEAARDAILAYYGQR